MDVYTQIVFTACFFHCFLNIASQQNFSGCFGSQTDIYINETIQYDFKTLESGGCRFHFWTAGISSVVSIFEGIENKSLDDYINMKIYDGDTTSANAVVRLDADPGSYMLYDTAIASEGTDLTIVFNGGIFDKPLKLTIERLESSCGKTYSSMNGSLQIPTYTLSSRKLYPKNLLCVFNIKPFMGSTVKLLFPIIDLPKDVVQISALELMLLLLLADNSGSYELSVLYMSRAECEGNIQHKHLTYYLYKSWHYLPEAIRDNDGNTLHAIQNRTPNGTVYDVTARTVSVVLDSVPKENKVTERGYGFTLYYEVCQSTYTITNSSQTLSFDPVISLEIISKCAYTIIAEIGHVPTLSVLNNSTKEIPMSALEVFDDDDPPNLLAKLKGLAQNDSETYISNTQQMIVVYTGDRNHTFPLANYSSFDTECYNYQRNRTFSPVTYFGKYANNFDCNYTINTGSNEHVFLYLSQINLAGQSCEDYIQIYDSSGLREMVCNTSSFAFAAHTSEITLRFKTDSIGSDLGFIANWSVCGKTYSSPNGIFASEQADLVVPILTNCSYIVGDIKENKLILFFEYDNLNEDCIWVKGIDDDINSVTCINMQRRAVEMNRGVATILYPSNSKNTFTAIWTTCGVISGNGTGTIRSMFSNRTDECFVIIETKSSEAIYFLLDSQLSQDNCSVTVGESLNSSSCLRKFDQVKGGFAIMRFKLTSASMFTVTWTETPLRLTSESGVISSFGYPDGYPTDAEIVYVIETMNGDEAISITFLDLAVGNNSAICVDEYVQIQSKATDGEVINMTLCGELSYLQNKKYSSYGSVVISLHTGSTVYKGFNLTYVVSDITRDSTTNGPITKGDTLSGAAIAGIVVAIVIVVILAAVLAYFFVIRRRIEERIHNTREESDKVAFGNATYENDNDSGNEPVYVERAEGIYDVLRQHREKINPMAVTFFGPDRSVNVSVHNIIKEIISDLAAQNSINGRGKQKVTFYKENPESPANDNEKDKATTSSTGLRGYSKDYVDIEADFTKSTEGKELINDGAAKATEDIPATEDISATEDVPSTNDVTATKDVSKI